MSYVEIWSEVCYFLSGILIALIGFIVAFKKVSWQRLVYFVLCLAVAITVWSSVIYTFMHSSS